MTHLFRIILAIIIYIPLVGAMGTSRAFLEQVPMTTIIDTYANHIDTLDHPELKQYANFFKDHQPLFDEILAHEDKHSDDYHVLYHGANGPRLIFDTIAAIQAAKQPQTQAAAPEFVYFRDADDPNALIGDLWETLTSRWPLLYPDEKQRLLSAIVNEDITEAQAVILWDVFWGDLHYTHDLTTEERQTIAPFLTDAFDGHLQVFRAMRSGQWHDWNLTDAERTRIATTEEKLKKDDDEALLMMQVLDDAYDFDTEFRQKNIAVNLSLFSGCVLRDRKVGLYPSKDECTPLYWFATDLGPHRYERNKQLRSDLLEVILRRHHIPTHEVEALERIHATLQPADGQQLFQIFVPKVMVPDARGKKQPLIDQIFYLSHKIGRPAYYLDRRRPSEVLETYRDDPSQIPGFLQLQGRLVFTKHGMLDPKSGIRIRTYYLPGASRRRMGEYHARLQNWAKRVLGHLTLSQPQVAFPYGLARSTIHVR